MFFTLSLGFGALTAFASYMPYDNQVMRDCYIVVFTNCGTSLFAGIVVFSILGYREHITGIPATEVSSTFFHLIMFLGKEICFQLYIHQSQTCIVLRQ